MPSFHRLRAALRIQPLGLPAFEAGQLEHQRVKAQRGLRKPRPEPGRQTSLYPEVSRRKALLPVLERGLRTSRPAQAPRTQGRGLEPQTDLRQVLVLVIRILCSKKELVQN